MLIGLQHYYAEIRYSFIRYRSLTSPLYVHFTWLKPPGRTAGRGSSLWITYMISDHTKTWKASPDKWSAQCRATSETTRTKKMIPFTHLFILTGVYDKDNYDGQMIFGEQWGLKLPDISLTGKDKPKKTSPTKVVPTRDRTRAPCVTGAPEIRHSKWI